MTTETTYDWQAIVDGLNRYLRLRSIPFGMKLFETVEAMEAIPKIRRPRAKHTTDQIVAQARQLGWTVGITMADLVGAQCGAVIGLHPQDDEWLSGKRMAGVWFATQADASLHQHAMDCVPHGRYRAMARAPLRRRGRRRIADGHPPALSSKGRRGPRRPRQERSPLPDSALRHPIRRRGGPGRQLRQGHALELAAIGTGQESGLEPQESAV